MAFSEQIYAAVKQYFIDDDAHFDEDEENGYFVANYAVGKNDCPVSSARLHFLIHTDGFTARLAIKGIKAVQKAFPYVGVLLTYINDGMRYGNFEMDNNDGEVAFKLSCLVPEGADLNYDYLDKIVCIGLAMIKRYADALVPIMLGYSLDPKAAYESVEKDD